LNVKFGSDCIKNEQERKFRIKRRKKFHPKMGWNSEDKN